MYQKPDAADRPTMPRFTAKQGQYLAFIHAYTLVLGRSPAQANLQRFFRVSPPSVHQMLLTLERQSLIRRTPGTPRSIQLLVPRSCLPDLQPVEVDQSNPL
jgi:SOS-response transcriptional repressor LexA